MQLRNGGVPTAYFHGERCIGQVAKLRDIRRELAEDASRLLACRTLALRLCRGRGPGSDCALSGGISGRLHLHEQNNAGA